MILNRLYLYSDTSSHTSALSEVAAENLWKKKFEKVN